MLKKETIELFKEKVKKESAYIKYLNDEPLNKLLNCFSTVVQVKPYPTLTLDSLNFVLDFFKYYNAYYYEIIISGISSNQIIIGKEVEQSTCNPDFTYIKLIGDAGDIFRLAHEFAHYVDRNLKPALTPKERNYFCEVFSYYIEKHLELFLLERGMDDIVSSRRYNRIAKISDISLTIKDMLQFEENYRKIGLIDLTNEDKIKSIMRYRNRNLVNHMLRYPLGEVCSEYLIKNNLQYDYDTIDLLRSQDFDEFLVLVRKIER